MPTSSDADESSQPVSDQGFSGLLPNKMLRFRRPVWWQELLLIGIGYFLYGRVRNVIPGKDRIAFKHARGIEHLQSALHLNFELTINKFVAAHEPLAQTMDYYYATLHFIVTPAVLVWLFVRRPALYRGLRTVLFATSLLALACFYLYPLAPPRLMPRYGYIDTILKFHTWGSLADPNIAQHSNQFAAMPSLHTAWALWCGISIAYCTRHQWIRVLALLYPIATVTVIIGTANHFVLDALGGALTLAAGFGIQLLLSGHGAFVAPHDSPTRVTAVRKTPVPPLPGPVERFDGSHR